MDVSDPSEFLSPKNAFSEQNAAPLLSPNSSHPQLDDPVILVEDGPLLGVFKPAGLLTQGVPHGLPTLEGWVKDWLKQKYQKAGNVYLGIPHRLDRPVSGAMIFARNSKAAARLAEQFRERSVRKWYLCVVEGTPPVPTGEWSDWLLKDAAAAHVTVVAPHTPQAKIAQLRYEVLEQRRRLTLLRIELLTGRMHQIRVQLASRGLPIVGDFQYGSAIAIPGLPTAHQETPLAILLHSTRLELQHPIRYDAWKLEIPIPSFWSTSGLWEKQSRDRLETPNN